MGCGCGKRGRQSAEPGSNIGYYVITPTGEEIPPVSSGAAPFMSPIEARMVVRRAGGGTIRAVKAK